jgi:hypothetical protein
MIPCAAGLSDDRDSQCHKIIRHFPCPRRLQRVRREGVGGRRLRSIGSGDAIRILAGLSLPTCGTVRVNGLDVTTQGVRVKAATDTSPPAVPVREADRPGAVAARDESYSREWRDCETRATELLAHFGTPMADAHREPRTG